VELVGPTLAQKKITVQILDEIAAQIERFLLIQLFTTELCGRFLLLPCVTQIRVLRSHPGAFREAAACSLTASPSDNRFRPPRLLH
jgi:hypothetical protein